MTLPLTWITAFIDLPAVGYAESEAFWVHVLGGRLSDRRGPQGEWVTVLPEAGEPYVRLQKVFSGPGGVHLDLHVAPGAVDAAADEALRLGAGLRHREDEWVVLTSPGGLSFCVTPWSGGRELPPLRDGLGGAGGPHRLEQVCLDIPPSRYEREVRFWADLTGWGLEPDEGNEFRGLPRPAGMPLRLLLQRRDDDEPAVVTAHPDFACADRDALTPAHEAAGARYLSRFEGWTQMAAPGGHVYCLTRRSPTAPPYPQEQAAGSPARAG
jgi:glyoxalase superfamily protein